eukprot:187166_1
MVGIVIATVILIAVIMYCKRLQNNKGIDNEEDSQDTIHIYVNKDNKMTEQRIELAEPTHDEQHGNNPQNMVVMNDIAKNEKEPGQEDSNSSSDFDDIFVEVRDEES